MITVSASTLLSALRVAALAPALSFVAPCDASAQAPSGVYERRDECIEAAVLSAEQCDFAYRNARAEFEQKAPRYASRVACERSHKRCGAQVISSGGWDSFGRGGASYVPRLTGIRIAGAGAARRAVPVVEGSARIAFAGRPVTELQDKVAGRQATVGLASARHGSSGRPGVELQHNSGPYMKRGDRDDTVRVPMEQKQLGADVAPGLYVDPDGVEWYKPAHKR